LINIAYKLVRRVDDGHRADIAIGEARRNGRRQN
jgi:hypothetical protein